MSDNYYYKDSALEKTQNIYLKARDNYYDAVIENLKKSTFPRQWEDFYFLVPPKKHPLEGKLVPVDWKMTGLVQMLWDNDISTIYVGQGWDSNEPNQFSLGYLTFNKKTINGDNSAPIVIKILQKALGNSRVNIIDKEKESWKNDRESDIAVKKIISAENEFLFKNPKSVNVLIAPNFDSVGLRSSMIPVLYEALGIKPPDPVMRHPGGLVD